MIARFLSLLILLSPCCAFGQTRDEKVRNDKTKVEAAGVWIYNDLPKAIDEAKKSNKPIIVVLRCIPCEECVKLDDELIDADERLKGLLDKFVRVRIISTNGLDLSLFQFDTDQSFAVFFLNADGAIYGRFGTRSHRTNWVGDVSVPGLAKAMEGALDLHTNYPKNSDILKLKRGAVPEYDRPEKYPSLKDRYKSTIDYTGKTAASCIHCHQIGDADREVILKAKKKLPEATLFPYPHPKTVGLTLDPKERANILAVEEKSDAAKAGFQKGDTIRTLARQPLLSIADVQWVLHNTPAAGGEVKAEITRDGKAMELTLKLPAEWRRRDDISWRASTWGLRRVALGGMFLVPLPEDERNKRKLGDKPALLIQHVGQFAPHDFANRAGLRKGDIVLSFDGKAWTRETDMIAYSLWEKNRGDTVDVKILRDGEEKTIRLKLPD